MVDVLSILFPVFGLVLIGYVFGKRKILAGTNAKSLNDYVYYIGLPVLLFYQTAQSSIQDLLNWGFILTTMLSTLILFVICYLVLKYVFSLSLKQCAAGSFSVGFANVAFMGIPLFIAAFGESETLPAIIMAVVANIVVLGTVVLLIEFSETPVRSVTAILKQLSSILFHNPLVNASLLGGAWSFMRWPFPVGVESLLNMISQSAAPIALISIGLSMCVVSVRIDRRLLTTIVILKMFLFPAVTYFVAHFIFQLDSFWAFSAVLLTALPTGTLVYVVCQKYDVFVYESSAIFLVTTLVSVCTLPIILLFQF